MEKIFEVQRIKQVIKENEYGMDIKKICSPSDAANIAVKFIGDEDREVFLVLCLNTKNEVVGAHRCHIGSIDSSIVHPREVYKSAILNNSRSIIVAHNHPSYELTPSREDIEVTKRLVEAGRILGIELLDHLIVNGKGQSVSLKEKGYIL
ncbi:DNA repair protein RadC [Cytobacillus oceanisediminis]|uniref:JAB domain-containing protein n=1 Tax=Cytobacillus oceanisediminis TaxID=665099 RepID=UPI001C246DE7|nr:JAB domain-containing protein [Cytobacillus oceanisediminis]MBU8732553.1 DNA repair protein RadC [Cytobacillus oceanisediminis]